jgi:hypothetical protein
MTCPHCEYELKINTLIDLAREILAKVSHCPNNGIKEVFDREFARDNASAEATFPSVQYGGLDRDLSDKSIEPPHTKGNYYPPCSNCGASRFLKDNHDYATGETLENKP